MDNEQWIAIKRIPKNFETDKWNYWLYIKGLYLIIFELIFISVHLNDIIEIPLYIFIHILIYFSIYLFYCFSIYSLNNIKKIYISFCIYLYHFTKKSRKFTSSLLIWKWNKIDDRVKILIKFSTMNDVWCLKAKLKHDFPFS